MSEFSGELKSIYSDLQYLIKCGHDMQFYRDLADKRPQNMPQPEYSQKLAEAGVLMRKYQSRIGQIKFNLSSLYGPLPLALYALACHVNSLVSLSSIAYRDYQEPVKQSVKTVELLINDEC